jgi:signal transduction histidine kinase
MVLDIGLMHKNMKNKLFQNARLKLTAYYVFIMSIILIIFSGALIYTIDINIEENLSGKIIITENVENPLDHTTDEIENLIYYIDGILLMIIAILSYFLAGRTLKPINDNLNAQKQFSTDASHDLRTPISIIISESEVALSENNNKYFKNVIQSNLEEAKKMSKLVNDLLLISRGEDKDINNIYTRIDLHNFMNKIVSKMKVQALNKGLTLVISNYIKIFTKVNISNFERAILNILQNAINYTNKGGIKVTVTDDNKKAYIEISDTGVGIKEEDLPFVFDRFYKAEHSRNDQSGSGLGLCISKQIITEHNGGIEIKSKVNVGTTITISIPKEKEVII